MKKIWEKLYNFVLMFGYEDWAIKGWKNCLYTYQDKDVAKVVYRETYTPKRYLEFRKSKEVF